MEKFNGDYSTMLLCRDGEHDLVLYYDKSDGTFFAYCKKCGWSPRTISKEYLDDLFV